MDKKCTYLFFLHDCMPPPHFLTSVAGMIRCEQHRLKFPKIHVKKILKLPPVGQWVCDKSRDILRDRIIYSTDF